MLGKLSRLKWTSGGGSNRDLAFLIVFLAFSVILALKLAPYYQAREQNVTYNQIQTTPSIPKSFMELLSVPFTSSTRPDSARTSQGLGGSSSGRASSDRPSIVERPLFDGQSILLKVRSVNPFTSNDTGQPIEVQVVGSGGKVYGEIDLTPAIGGKLVGAGSPNLSAKRLYISFNELVSADGRSYPVQGQAVGSESLTSGIEGDYSSGLPARLLGITLDRAITAVDQIGTAYLFTSLGPEGPGAQELRTAAMQVNQQASQNISAEATKDLRETPAEISLPAGSVFLVRVRAPQTGVHR